MEEGVSRIRRRVSVRKRNRLSIDNSFTSPTKPSDEKEEEKEEGEMVTESRRRKLLGVQSVEQHNDSEEDLFSECDSFAENSILAQVDDLEQRHMHIAEHKTHSPTLTTEELHSEEIKPSKLSIPKGGNMTELIVDGVHIENQSGCQEGLEEPEEPEVDILFDIPSSQELYFENLQHTSGAWDDPIAAEERAQSLSSLQTTREESPCHSVKRPPQVNDSSSCVQPSSDVNRRKSLKDHLKSAMADNARAQTPIFSRTKQLKETLLNEEINVAKKTIESSSDDLGPFYSLPSKVRDLYVQFKGIEKLYGNALLLEWKKSPS